LGITIEGKERAEISNINERQDKLLIGDLSFIEPEKFQNILEDFNSLIMILKSIKPFR